MKFLNITKEIDRVHQHKPMNHIDSLIKPYMMFRYAICDSDMAKKIFYMLYQNALNLILVFHGQWFINIGSFFNCQYTRNISIIDIKLYGETLLKYVSAYNVPGLFRYGDRILTYQYRDNKWYNIWSYNVESRGSFCSCACRIPGRRLNLNSIISFEGKNNEIIKRMNNLKCYKENQCVVCLRYSTRGIYLTNGTLAIPIKFVNGRWIHDNEDTPPIFIYQ